MTLRRIVFIHNIDLPAKDEVGSAVVGSNGVTHIQMYDTYIIITTENGRVIVPNSNVKFAR